MPPLLPPPLFPFKMCEIEVELVAAALVRSDWSSENGNQMLASRLDAGADTDDEDDGDGKVSEIVSLWSRVDVTPNPIS